MADSYESAFYEIAAMLGIPAQPAPPKEVFEQQMKPRLRALLSCDSVAAASSSLPEAERTAAAYPSTGSAENG